MIARIVLPSIFDMIDNVDETNKTVGKNLRYLVEKRWDDSQEELARRLQGQALWGFLFCFK